MSNPVDPSKNYVGKVVKVYYNSNNTECSQTGIVFAQQALSSNYLKLSMLLTNGQVCDPIPFAITKVSSTRIDPKLKSALEGYCDAKIKEIAFLHKFREERAIHENRVASALERVKEYSNEVTYDTFMRTAEQMFRDRWPALEEQWYRRYFECDSITPNSVTLRQVQKVEIHASPDQYSFLGREYDGTLFLDYTHPQYRIFCEHHAPPVLPQLEPYAKTSVSASIGDEDWLSAQRSYKFPLKYGLTKQSLNQLRDIISAKEQAPKSLQDTLCDAKSRSEARTADQVDPAINKESNER